MAIFSTNKQQRSILPFIVFNFICFFFLIIFTKLGIWQVHRLSWKENLIKTVNSRITQPYGDIPSVADWPKLTDDNANYKPVHIEGRFLEKKPIYVTTMATDTVGAWQMLPLQINDGSIIFINRGFVPDSLRNTNSIRKPSEIEAKNLKGILRLSEKCYSFFYKNKPEKNKWYIRNTKEMAKQLGLDPNKVAPYFIDEAKFDDKTYPLGGLTKVHFRNSHLSYAITWFTLAIGMLMAIIYILKQEIKK